MNKGKKIFYSVSIIFLFIIMCFSAYFLYYFYSIKDSHVVTRAVQINEKNMMSYSVSTLDKNNTNQFLNSNIDDIKADYNYSISFDKKIDGEYSYIVKGYLVALDGTKKIKNREIYNSSLKKFKTDGNVINIQDTINLDFDTQYKEILKIRDDFGKDLKVYFDYEIDILYSVFNKYLNRSLLDTLELNFRVDVGNIESNITLTDNKDISRKDFSDITEQNKPIYIAICCEFAGVIVLCAFIILYIVRSIRRSVTKYQKMINSVLRRYDDIIVNLSDLPDLSDLQVLFVDSFKDLVDASCTLNLPINYTEVVKGRESTFIVLSKRMAYVYKISDKNNGD